MAARAARTRGSTAAAARLIAVAVSAVITPSVALAVNATWVGPNGGLWSTPANWNPAAVPSPLTADNVFITPTPLADYSVSLDADYPTDPLGTITLNSPNAFALSLNQASDSFNLRAVSEVIATTGKATYNHSAGSNVVSTLLALGDSTNALGTYSLSGTGFLSAPTANLGNAGTGSFTQSGGSASISSLVLGSGATGTGTYRLIGGTLAGDASVGLNGRGSFIQSAGTFTAPTSLKVGFNASSSGTYSLSGTGALVAPAVLDVGFLGVGSFTQTGGSVSAGEVTLGTLGYGYYTLSGGSLSANDMYLGGNISGPGGYGQLNISGTASVTVAGTLRAYDSFNNTINLSGGSLTVGTLDLFEIPFRLYWTGGTLRFANGYTVDETFALGEFANVIAGCTLASGAPSTNNASLSLDGGTLSGTAALTNNSTMDGFGTFAQPVVNAPTGSIRIYDSRTLTLTTSTILDNAGVITLNLGRIAGNGTLSNTGTISGPGSITARLANTGTIAIPAGSSSLPSFTNAGLITLDSAAALLSGGPITNAGTLQGRGRVNANVTNTGTIEPVAGILQLAGSVSNPAAGTLRATAATKLLVTGSFPTNAGTILLAGGTLDTNNQAITNTGSLLGNGLLAGGTFTNSGTVLLSGGSSTITAPVRNNATRTFTVQGTPALFTSLVTNNGTFQILSGAATFTAGFTATSSTSPGSLTIDATGAFLGNSITNNAVTSSGTITFRPSSQGGASSSVTSLTLNGGATVDIANNDFFVNYSSTSPLPTILQYILSAQIFSSNAINDAQHRLVLGYAEASSFTGVTSGPAFPDSTSLVVSLTYYGDATLDGRVNADDYARLDRGFARGLTGWVNGDFNYDNVINSADYLLIDRVFFQQGAPLSPEFLSTRESQFGAAYVTQLLAAIPEPSATALASVALTALSRRRRWD